jgi:hypothetical protein
MNVILEIAGSQKLRQVPKDHAYFFDECDNAFLDKCVIDCISDQDKRNSGLILGFTATMFKSQSDENSRFEAEYRVLRNRRFNLMDSLFTKTIRAEV